MQADQYICLTTQEMLVVLDSATPMAYHVAKQRLACQRWLAVVSAEIAASNTISQATLPDLAWSGEKLPERRILIRPRVAALLQSAKVLLTDLRRDVSHLSAAVSSSTTIADLSASLALLQQHFLKHFYFYIQD